LLISCCYEVQNIVKGTEDGIWNLINAEAEVAIAEGVVAIPPRFECIGRFVANGLARIKENGKWGYINTKGDVVISPRFEEVTDFDVNGVAVVKENGKYIYINAQGQTVNLK
jgi:hypothetical protein